MCRPDRRPVREHAKSDLITDPHRRVYPQHKGAFERHPQISSRLHDSGAHPETLVMQVLAASVGKTRTAVLRRNEQRRSFLCERPITTRERSEYQPQRRAVGRSRRIQGAIARAAQILGWQLRIGIFVAVCLSLLAVPAPAVAAPRLPSPAGWPLRGTPVVQRGFAPPALAWASGHRGVDLVAKPGEAILAAASGTVAYVGSIAGKPVVSIGHGSVRTTYEPVVSTLTVGERVALGQVIGVLGSGGHCRGCLHWGLREGTSYLDPLLLLGTRGGRLRLVAESQREVVRRAAQARARAAASATQASAIMTPAGQPGSHGFLHPVAGAVTSAFGMRRHPLLKIWKLHDGTDFGAACGTAIRAPYAGVVTRAVFSPAYGNRLFLSHGKVDGVRVETAFNHAARYLVRPGQRISRGQVIGEVGSTGFSTGCHLHLMVWLNGRLSNPMSWL
jgi:murein DD-endopeptidase MepM/ murein hydrolase activator NlpD